MSARKIIDKAEKKKNANTDNQNILKEYSIRRSRRYFFLRVSFFFSFLRAYLLCCDEVRW